MAGSSIQRWSWTASGVCTCNAGMRLAVRPRDSIPRGFSGTIRPAFCAPSPIRLSAMTKTAPSMHGTIGPGTRIGSYEVVALIGVGGMGEVYRAHDSKLGRDVAVKVLPRDVCNDPDRVARLQREARVLAALNHRHIAAIHGLEEIDGSAALILELVEGPTLAERIAAGLLPLDEAVAIATQIAEALGAAHDKGIVHRDLKPANIKVTDVDTVKVLDFGLARMAVGDNMSDGVVPPTTTAHYTRQGVVLGTAAYMSPEQARGLPTDRRTDVWAFGCVLYEMLAARSAFGKATVSDTIAAVLERDPDWAALPPATPRAIRSVLEQCLEKDCKRRRRDVLDIALDLERSRRTPARDENTTVAQPPRRRGVATLALVAAIAVAAAAAWFGSRANIVAPEVAEFTVYPPRGTTFPLEVGAPWPTLSPDGRQLAFVAVTANGVSQIWLRPVGSTVAQPLGGAEGGARPFWAPNSRAIGFFADGKIKRIDLSNGNVQNVCDAPFLGSMSATWGGGDVILFTHVGGLFRVPGSGGTPVIALPDRSRQGDRYQPQNPSFFPDGRRFAFVTLRAKPEDSEICVGSLDSQETRCILRAESPARYASGYLLFGRDGVLRLQRFDPERFATSGAALPVSAARVRVTPVWRPPPFSIAADVLAFHPGTAAAQLVWRDRTGATVATVAEPDDYGGWSASQDGRRVAVSRADPRTGNVDIWLKEPQRDAWSRVTFDQADDSSPIFSPDGTRVVFASTRGGIGALYVKATGAIGSEQRLATFDVTTVSPHDWSPDGRLILYNTFSSKTGWDIGVVPADGSSAGKLVIESQHGERGGRFSPDMKWIAYDSTESGRREVWIQPFPPTGDRWQVSTTGGIGPKWRRDGKELFYVAADGMLMAMPIDPGAAPVLGSATPLFQTLGREGGAPFHVSPDGTGFLMPTPPSLLDVAPITVRLNWRTAIEQH